MTTVYYCPDCGTQAGMNEDHPDYEDGKPRRCQNCGSEEVFDGTQDEYEDSSGDESSFSDELQDVEGIGPSRAEEVDELYDSWEELNSAIYSDDDSGLKDKTEELLKAHLEE